MKKSILVLAVALASTSTLQAKELEVYGKINVTAQSSDDGEGRFTELKSNASRFGLKGDYALEDGLSVTYQLEWEVDPSDEANEKNIKARNQYLGLAGSFGEVRVGRHDSALKMSQGKIDLFNDYEADIKVLWKGENRVSNSISYFTPSFSGFSAQVTYVVEDSPAGEDGISAALMYGDDGLKNSNVYAALAYDAEVNGYDTVRASGQVKVAGFKLGAMYQTQESTSTTVERDGYLVSVAYPMGKAELKGQYQVMEDDNGFSAGVDYKLGKNTKVFAWYSSFDFDEALDKDYLAVGLEHKF
ncbi:porin [Rheinheimera baltica]|uniref:Porin n=1 Tax=Rheinheimera baltica TaxID=67576 RepID=A0ABT9HZT8_9GAMM|nr:porin [Rheinheimera baltica]MDP5136201.1 porin [Rheinheimera baltica]